MEAADAVVRSLFEVRRGEETVSVWMLAWWRDGRCLDVGVVERRSLLGGGRDGKTVVAWDGSQWTVAAWR